MFSLRFLWFALSLPLHIILPFLWVSFFLCLISNDRQTEIQKVSLRSPVLQLSPPFLHLFKVVASQQELFVCGAQALRVSLLINELPPHSASFHPSILQTHIHSEFFFFARFCHCSSLRWPAVHVHNPVVFSLDSRSKTFPSIMLSSVLRAQGIPN